MARMLGRFRWGGCGNFGCRLCGPGDTRAAKRAEQREAEREFSRYPTGYSPATLLAGARHDTPDLTGELIDWRYAADGGPGTTDGV